jgi:hypothetical protein
MPLVTAGVAAAAIVCAMFGLGVATARAASAVRPRSGAALGIVPAHGHELEIATGQNFPVVYHGGPVMHNVTIHTVFWAPNGFAFDGSPGLGVQAYVPLVQQFFGDVAHDSGGAQNVYSVLSSYPDANGPAYYQINYSPAADSVYDTDPYPPASKQCPSPAGVATCVTDLEVQQELDKVSGQSPGGLNDVWFMFLPPDVDECTFAGSCGTNTFAGYHSLGNLGHGIMIYAVIPDPLIEFTPGPGSDPNGNPEAESTIDTVAHELLEAITDPEGTAWMDPNGFETADKCETAPEEGTPLGYALNGSPYNQVINGHVYLIQMMWSNTVNGCVQRSTSVTVSAGLASVKLTQFSSLISGNTGVAKRGVPVLVGLLRANRLVTVTAAVTGSTGRWGPVSLGNHAFGDDRDVIAVVYGPGGPRPDVIAPGAGGNPFTESGFTGWFDLDHGYRVGSHSVTLSPCGQTGVLSLSVGGRQTAPPVEQCQTEADIATIETGRLGPGTSLAMASSDNRGGSGANPFGALVKMTIPLGEPGAVSSVANDQIVIEPSGFPACSANLAMQVVTCNGLVPGTRYALRRRRGHAERRAKANGKGAISVTGLSFTGGDRLELRNRAGRVLTLLHVARLRVNINGNQTTIASGRCQAGDYFGPPVGAPPLSVGVGVPGVAGTGTICPLNGRARGLTATQIVQTDDFSGGETRTEVPLLEGASPAGGGSVYGPFIALARAGIPGRHGAVPRAPGGTVGLTITRAGSGRPLFTSPNVDTPRGVPVTTLSPGVYNATWAVRDVNGDTRTVRTDFVEEP